MKAAHHEEERAWRADLRQQLLLRERMAFVQTWTDDLIASAETQIYLH